MAGIALTAIRVTGRRGLRIPVATVVGMIAVGMTPDEIVGRASAIGTRRRFGRFALRCQMTWDPADILGCVQIGIALGR